jgi:hypothetical protein
MGVQSFNQCFPDHKYPYTLHKYTWSVPDTTIIIQETEPLKPHIVGLSGIVQQLFSETELLHQKKAYMFGPKGMRNETTH